jgi:hypothetical protein
MYIMNLRKGIIGKVDMAAYFITHGFTCNHIPDYFLPLEVLAGYLTIHE